MKLKFFTAFMALLIAVETFFVVKIHASSGTNIPVPNTSISVGVLQVQVETYQERINTAMEMIELALKLDYDFNHPVVKIARQEIQNSQREKEYYEELLEIENQKWEKRMEEYPAATEIWLYLKNLGYSDYVCAGILGNIMTEVGGQTLNIQYWLSNAYYGMCQWSKGYGEVWGKDLNGQLDFLAKTIQYEFDTYGNKYQKGFNFEKFLALEDEQEAAKAFAKCYERCGSFSYTARKSNAKKAFKYFTE